MFRNMPMVAIEFYFVSSHDFVNIVEVIQTLYSLLNTHEKFLEVQCFKRSLTRFERVHDCTVDRCVLSVVPVERFDIEFISCIRQKILNSVTEDSAIC